MNNTHLHFVIGRNSLNEILHHNPRAITKVFCLQLTKDSSPRAKNLVKNLKDQGIEIETMSRRQLDRLAGTSSHQGFVASVKPKKSIHLNDFLTDDSTRRLVVILDTIEDPHNLGAILRACECFGVDLVIWSKNRGAQLSPTVSKVSSGAAEIVPTHIVSNLSDVLKKFEEKDYHIVGAQVNKTSYNLFDYKFPQKVVLILGSEGKGIRALLQKQVQSSLYIPMYGQLDSLNVSQAAALILGIWRMQS